jgi:hypothetical protein
MVRQKLARAGLAAACLGGGLLFAPNTLAATTQIGAPANVMLHVGSHGQRVKDLQWLLGNHSPNVFRATKVKPTFTGKPNGLLGERTGKAVIAYKWQLGYPTRMLKQPVAGPYFFELLTGKAQRPIAWVARASKRYSDPETQPTELALRIRTLELSQLGVSELPLGSNRGYPKPYEYQRVTGAIGLAWCVSFQQWAFKSSGAGTFAYSTAAVYTAVDWAHGRGLLRSRPKIGALVAFVDYDRYGHRIPGTGHMGYVVRVTVSGFVSVEGNSSNRVLERYHQNNERPHVFIYLKGVA